MANELFPVVRIPDGLPANHRKTMIVILLAEAGFFTSNDFHRKRLAINLAKEHPELMVDQNEPDLDIKNYIDLLKQQPEVNGRKGYEKAVQLAKKHGLWEILNPKGLEDTILAEVKKCAEGKVVIETDWFSIINDLGITNIDEIQRYRDYLAENEFTIKDSTATIDSLVDEYEDFNSSETLPSAEIMALFVELRDASTLSDRKTKVREIIFMANQRLVSFVLDKMKSFANYSPARDREDDMQTGNVALLAAIDGFDETKGNLFSTYAVKCIRGNVLRFRNKNRYSQHVPENQNLQYQKAIKTKNREEARLGREITVKEWAKLMEMSIYKLERLLDIHQETVYFGSPVHSASDDLLLEETISDRVDVEDEVLSLTLSEKLSDALARLDPREEAVVRLRTGFYHTKEQLEFASIKLGRPVHRNEAITFDEIANAFGITRERVRQILDGAYRTLRHPGVSMEILDYVNDME